MSSFACDSCDSSLLRRCLVERLPRLKNETLLRPHRAQTIVGRGESYSWKFLSLKNAVLLRLSWLVVSCVVLFTVETMGIDRKVGEEETKHSQEISWCTSTVTSVVAERLLMNPKLHPNHRQASDTTPCCMEHRILRDHVEHSQALVCVPLRWFHEQLSTRTC